jgi:TPR repeat protein
MAASAQQALVLSTAGRTATTGQASLTQMQNDLAARAKRGEKDAAFQLGVAHTRGHLGLHYDLPKAREYFKIALEWPEKSNEEVELTFVMAAEKFCLDNKDILGEELIARDVAGEIEFRKGSYSTQYIPSKFLSTKDIYDGNIPDDLKRKIATEPGRQERSRSNVAKHMQECAEAGLVAATGFLGRLHCEAYGVDENIPEGVRLLKQAANAGDAQSSLYLGKMHHKGLGVEINLQEAHAWYTAAKNQDIPEAQAELKQIARLKKAAKCVLL